MNRGLVIHLESVPKNPLDPRDIGYGEKAHLSFCATALAFIEIYKDEVARSARPLDPPGCRAKYGGGIELFFRLRSSYEETLPGCGYFTTPGAGLKI